MYKFAVFTSMFLLVSAAIDYVRRAWIKQTSPTLATWILLWVMMILSCTMYWLNPQHTLTGNIGVIGNVINTTTVLCGLIVINLKHQTFKVAFNRFQVGCLIAGGMMAGLWFVTRNPLISYILLQLIGVLAYSVTVYRLLKTKQSSEPLIFWVICFFGNLCAAYPGWVKDDLYAQIYLGRVIPTVGTLIVLIWYFRRRPAA